MGKLKTRSKLAQRRFKAKQLQKNKKTENEINVAKINGEISNTQKVAPLITKLGSSSESDRSMALNSINLMCGSDTELRRLFMKNDLVQIILSKLLHDENQDIVVDSYGLLRNLMIDEGYSLCIHLWRKDIWTLLSADFARAIASLPHISDENVDQQQKELLVNFIDNLIGCTDCLASEMSINFFDGTLFGKITESKVLDFIFSILKQETNQRLILSCLTFIYDLATVSYKFIDFLCQNNEYLETLKAISNKKLGKQSKTYLIASRGKERAFKRKRLCTDIISPLNDIYQNDVNLKYTVEELDLPYNENPSLQEAKNLELAKQNFNVIDLELDLYTSIIEMLGDDYRSQEGDNKNGETFKFLNSTLVSMLSSLIEAGFKDEKMLICVNNLIAFDRDIRFCGAELVSFFQNVYTHCSVLLSDLLENKNQLSVDEQLEQIGQILKFDISYMLMTDQSQWKEDAQRVVEIIRLSESVDTKLDAGEVDAGLLSDFNLGLIPYLGLIAKNCGNLSVTRDITKFLVDQKFLKYLELYKKTPKVEKLHKNVGFLVEETIDCVVNVLFDIFDDDYSYNKPIFHDGGLLQVLKDKLSEFRIIFKKVDKNVSQDVKERMKETLNNLQSFVKYKQGELK
ncbi:hypothetical protein HII13_004037 [Brettanomyces bruxellensis]|nr:hypothetical protein HII13_004037 [Brettanomyces bruxellensis]